MGHLKNFSAETVTREDEQTVLLQKKHFSAKLRKLDGVIRLLQKASEENVTFWLSFAELQIINL